MIYREESLSSWACEQLESTLIGYIQSTRNYWEIFLPEYPSHLEHKVKPEDESHALRMFGRKIANVINTIYSRMWTFLLSLHLYYRFLFHVCTRTNCYNHLPFFIILHQDTVISYRHTDGYTSSSFIAFSSLSKSLNFDAPSASTISNLWPRALSIPYGMWNLACILIYSCSPFSLPLLCLGSCQKWALGLCLPHIF